LSESELNTLGYSLTSPGFRTTKVSKLYCDLEVQALAVLKSGSLGAVRKRRASWQTSVEEMYADGSRKAAKLLQTLKLQSNHA